MGIGFRTTGTIQNNVREKSFFSKQDNCCYTCVIKILIKELFLSRIVTLGSIKTRGKLYVQLPRVRFENIMYGHQPEFTNNALTAQGNDSGFMSC